MDVVSKFACVFISTRLKKTLKRHGVACRFWAKPKIRCKDVVFAINSFLQELRGKQLDAHVVLINLVKVRDYIQHDVIKETLVMFGVPCDVSAWTMKSRKSCSVVLKVELAEKLMTHGCGSNQGDSLAPRLLMMATKLATQDIESEFKNSSIRILKVLVSSKVENKIRKHKNNNMKVCH